MKLSYVITFIAAIGFTIAGSYFYRLIPEYESAKKEENAESKEAVETEETVETEESKEHKEVKKYVIISVILSMIASLFYIFLYKKAAYETTIMHYKYNKLRSDTWK